MPLATPLLFPPLNIIHVASLEAMGDLLIPFAAKTTTNAWPAANRAIAIPFTIAWPVTIVAIGWFNGTSVSGNVDVGIYDETGATKLVSSGSTAQSGTSAIQTVSITPTVLPPGTYYVAMVLDNGTGATFCWTSPAATLMRAFGIQQMASAFALPSSLTLANPASAYIPEMWLMQNATM